MPPSGFSAVEVLPMEHFLKACALALKKEASRRAQRPDAAAAEEVASISRALEHKRLEPIETSVLEILKDFYGQLAKARLATWDDEYRSFVDQLVTSYRLRLLNLHI